MSTPTVFVIPEKKAEVITADLDGWKKVEGGKSLVIVAGSYVTGVW
jgi:hypothetical protein